MLGKRLSILLVMLMFVLCFTAAGIADGIVNNDWNRLNSVPVTIETHYVINGNDYVVDVNDVNAVVTWEGDIPSINIINGGD